MGPVIESPRQTTRSSSDMAGIALINRTRSNSSFFVGGLEIGFDLFPANDDLVVGFQLSEWNDNFRAFALLAVDENFRCLAFAGNIEVDLLAAHDQVRDGNIILHRRRGN